MHMDKPIKQSCITDKILLFVFLIIYHTTATIYDFSFDGILRWIGCFGLVFFFILYMLKTNMSFKNSVLPRPFVFLLFPFFVQSLWNINFIGLSLSRNISFFIYCIAIYSVLSKKNANSEYIKDIYLFYIKVSIVIVFSLNIVNLGNYSINGDFYGIYANRTVTSCVFLSIIVMTVFFLFQKNNKIVRIVLAVMLIVEIYMIFETHSRVAFLGVCFIFASEICFMQNKIGIRWKIFTAALIVLFAVLLPYIGEKFNIEAINRVFSETDVLSSTGLKRNTWDFGYQLISQRPIEGWGNNAVYYNTFVNPIHGWGVHSSYLIMIIEGGIIGGIFYFLFFYSFFKNNYIKYKYCKGINLSSKDSEMIKTMIIICGVLLLNAVSESFLFSAGNLESLPFWFSMLSLYRFLECKKNEAEGINQRILVKGEI